MVLSNKMIKYKFEIIFIFAIFNCYSGHEHLHTEDAFSAGTGVKFEFEAAKPTRYLIYEINPDEGFNLRRDVYIRLANLIKVLNQDERWTLVLPPWNRLYHWQSPIEQSQIPWSTFFDLESLQRYIPVIEFVDFLNATDSRQIDQVFYLQQYKEGWKDGNWEEKIDRRECIESTSFIQDTDGSWLWWFWDYPNVTAKNFECLSVQAQATFMKDFLIKTDARSVFLLRAEQLIHGQYSEWSVEYWTARRSMRFASHLRRLADEFRLKFLDSSDDQDKTELDSDWRSMKRDHGEAVGGPYLAVHLRRKDFLYSHKEEVPSLSGAAKQIKRVLQELSLTIVFIASDAPKRDFEELSGFLSEYKVVRYQPSEDVLKRYKDGGAAIIDQWICAHARHFIGTSTSTFSFRIHEEREILGFKSESTFNRLCPDTDEHCGQPTKWTVKYESR